MAVADEDRNASYNAVVSIAQESLTAIEDILAGMSSEQANRVPDLAGANSPYAIGTHCVGMVEYWGGSVIAGLGIPRDRDVEFQAVGDPQVLRAEIARIRQRFAEWAAIGMSEGPRDRSAVGTTRSETVRTASATWMLLHVVRELAQHLGQLEITRDILTKNEHGPPVT